MTNGFSKENRRRSLSRFPRLWKAETLSAAQTLPLLLWLVSGTLPVAAQTAPAQPQTSEPATAAPASGALTWHGITLYGAYDIGFGWVSHGLPENGYNYEGESLVNRNGYQHRFLLTPNNLQQTGFGIRGKEKFRAGMVGCLQRFHRHQSAVRPARQRVQDQHHQQRPSPQQLLRSHRRRARRPALQRRILRRNLLRKIRHPHLRPATLARHRRHAPLRSRRRQLRLLLHRL